jgi:heptosyltransferase-2
MTQMNADERVVVRMPNWLGDIVMALPALAMARRGMPASHLAMALPAAFAPIGAEAIDGAPDAVIAIRDGDRGGRGEAAALREARFDRAMLLTNSFRSALVARRARIRERWGYRGAWRSALLTRAIPRPHGRVHQSEYYRALMRALDMPDADVPPRIRVRPSTAARGRAALERAGVDPEAPLVGIAAGAAYGYAKRWPPGRVAAVIGQLQARGVRAVLVGTAGDRATGREIESAASPVNLIGRTDLAELMGVIARCRAFLSNDSGAMHLAAALGVPVVAVFGPTDERATAPVGDHTVLTADVFCRPCMLRECPIDHRCMKRITADAVAEALFRRIDRSAEAHA